MKTENTQETVEDIQEKNGASEESAEATPAEETKPGSEAGSGKALEDWKARARQWEDRSKSNKKELDAITAEREKDLERIAALEAEKKTLEESQASMLREMVAAVKGVPAHRITGSTREELEADADKFLSEINGSPKRGYVPSSATGGGGTISSVLSGRERAREALGKLSSE